MKVLFHRGYDFPISLSEIEDCVLDNRRAPIVRFAGEVFTTYYSIEWSYHIKHIIDPTRSYASDILALVGDEPRQATWVTHDILFYLLKDLGLWRTPTTWQERLAFHTLFPRGTAWVFSEYHHSDIRFIGCERERFRVINNPFFYCDTHATEKHLVPIVEDDGLRFALDRRKIIPSAKVLAREISLLNYGFRLTRRQQLPLQKTLEEAIGHALTAAKLSPWRLFPASEVLE